MIKIPYRIDQINVLLVGSFGYSQKNDFPKSEKEKEKAYNNLSLICLLAASSRAQELAEEIFKKCFEMASGLHNAQETIKALFIILIASATIKDSNESVKWLEERLLSFVVQLPNTEACKAVYEYIRLYRRYVPLEFSKLTRIEAMARLGSGS